MIPKYSFDLSQMKTGYVALGDSVLSTLLAYTPEEQERGLMQQEFPPPIMSFIYAVPSYNKFWMKNTQSPLDIIFCKQGRVIEICYGEPHSLRALGAYMSDLVVEVPFGYVDQLNIRVGQEGKLIRKEAHFLLV